MVEVGRDLLEVKCSKLSAQAGPPKAGCPGPCPDSFMNIAKVGDSATSPDNLCQRLVTLTVTKVFLGVRREPPEFQCVTVASGAVAGHC